MHDPCEILVIVLIALGHTFAEVGHSSWNVRLGLLTEVLELHDHQMECVRLVIIQILGVVPIGVEHM